MTPMNTVVRQEVQESFLGGIFTRRSLSVGLALALGFTLFVLSPMLVETNSSGYFTVKQAAGSGTMSVMTDPGMFWQMFGDIWRYKQSDIIHFSKHEGEGSDDAITVRFNDGAVAKVTGNIRIELPSNPEKVKEIHRKFRSYDAVVRDTVKQVVSESVILTAALMSAEESYTTKRAEFSQLADDQVKTGIFLTEADTIETRDPKTGEITKKQIVRIQTGKDGVPDRKESVLAQYGIRVTQFVIKDIDYEDGVDAQIQMKQQALMKTVAAKAEAEKAIQDRLTAEEVGKKNVAVARYEEEVEKIKAITEAEKQLDVARLGRQSAEQYKLTQILKAEGDAEYRRKIMVADGALEKKLEALKSIHASWADAAAKSNHPWVPTIVMGSNATGQTNAAQVAMEALGVKALRDLHLDMKTRANDKTAEASEEK